ncbi:MAG TPA: PfkB family carbohydrate kinase [Candidatus Acidoferrales bacterium]|jgi:sugar/nucleoside kinase (ribokinase family)|nr:PfkB family carbohydrate kinase [Candidatus Acidoferrales bacterium]
MGGPDGKPESVKAVDVVGVGINATDTIIRLPRFPAPDSKVEIVSSEMMPGGQVASAMVACRRWGLRARYVGKVGEDAAAQLQMDEMEHEQVDARWIIASGRESQTSYILVDESTGERTVLWKRDASIALWPGDLKREWIWDARILLVDGHDTEAAATAARWAKQEELEVVGDFDNRYLGVEAVLENTDYSVTSKDFPERLTGEKDLLKSLPQIFERFRCRLIAATLGRLGVLAWDGKRFLLCPGFMVDAVDTTGAGDIFHGAFVYGLAHKQRIEEILQFACAAAALNCMAPGARGNIAPLAEIQKLRRTTERSELAYTAAELHEAAHAANPGSKGAYGSGLGVAPSE